MSSMLSGHIWPIWQWDNQSRHLHHLIHSSLRLREMTDLPMVPATGGRLVRDPRPVWSISSKPLCGRVRWLWIGDVSGVWIMINSPRIWSTPGMSSQSTLGEVSSRTLESSKSQFLPPSLLFPWQRRLLPLIPLLCLISYLSTDKWSNSLTFFPYLLYGRGETPSYFLGLLWGINYIVPVKQLAECWQ